VCAASEGLGRAAAEALAAEGCRLAICSRRQDAIDKVAVDLRHKYGIDVLSVEADLRDAAQITRFVDAAVRTFGGLDVMVTNAGGPKPGLFDTLSDQDWLDAVQLLLMSAVRLSREAIPHMRRRGSGRIIHITSVAVKQPVAGLCCRTRFDSGGRLRQDAQGAGQGRTSHELRRARLHSRSVS
jgi:3-oxoacyl-[acyl-carrier protein] reductase